MAGRTSERLPRAGQNSCPRAPMAPVMVKYQQEKKEIGMVLVFFLNESIRNLLEIPSKNLGEV